MYLSSLRPLALECAAEFVGTFILVFLGTAGIATAAFTTPGMPDLAIERVALGWGFAVALATYVAGPASGAHLNPAVTLALAASQHNRSGFAKHKAPVYMLFQLLGATFAGLAVLATFGRAIKQFEKRLGIERDHANASLSAMAFGASFPHPQLVYAPDGVTTLWELGDVSAAGAVFLEAMGTMLFVLVQRAVRQGSRPTSDSATTISTIGGCEIVNQPSTRRPACPLAPVYIGSALAVLTMVMTPFTQACMNPARDFGPRVVAAIAGWGSTAMPGARSSCCWVYLVGPTIGAVTGSLLFDLLLYPGMQTRDEATVAWLRRQQQEGDAILEQLEKSTTLLSLTGFDELAGKGLHHSNFRESPTPHNYRLSSPGRLGHPFIGRSSGH